MIWDLVVGGITSLTGKYFDNKKEKQQAKHIRKLADINNKAGWETISIKGMAGSLKDEWWVMVFSIPLVAIFTSPFVDLLMSDLPYEQGSLLVAGKLALSGLSSAPDWYTYLLGMMIGASFGVKGVGQIMNDLRKKKT